MQQYRCISDYFDRVELALSEVAISTEFSSQSVDEEQSIDNSISDTSDDSSLSEQSTSTENSEETPMTDLQAYDLAAAEIEAGNMGLGTPVACEMDALAAIADERSWTWSRFNMVIDHYWKRRILPTEWIVKMRGDLICDCVSEEEKVDGRCVDCTEGS